MYDTGVEIIWKMVWLSITGGCINSKVNSYLELVFSLKNLFEVLFMGKYMPYISGNGFSFRLMGATSKFWNKYFPTDRPNYLFTKVCITFSISPHILYLSPKRPYTVGPLALGGLPSSSQDRRESNLQLKSFRKL